MTAIGAWAVLTDQIAYVVTRGVSMNPVYYEGDLVVLLRADDYQTGQIVAYRSGGSGTEVLHRIIDRPSAGEYALKGDNNESTDSVTPTADELIGRAVLHVPKGGFWLKPLLSPTGLGMIGFLIFSGGAASAVTRRQIPRGRRKKKVKAMARQGNAWTVAGDVAKAVKRLSPPLRVAAAGVIVMAAGAVLLGALGWMKPAIDHKVTGSGQSVTFSYSARVPRSAAYDETTVKSPDPIFRKIVNRVDLNLQYSGPPGNVDVSVGLFNEVGWHTTVPLAAPKRFLDRRHNSTVSLDLNALDQRAKDAAKAIGITPGSLSMSVDARIRSAGVPDFTASLLLSPSPCS